MPEGFEYRVCQVQYGRVTFVNGDWQGAIDPVGVNQEQAVQSCPYVWDYLQQAGREGWDLVAAQSQSHNDTCWQILYLKRRPQPTTAEEST